jgi:hypothetical protein
MQIARTTKEGKTEVVEIETKEEKKRKFRFLPLNEDKMMFIIWSFMLYISGLCMTYNILASLFLFFLSGTALLNSVGHLMKEKEEKENV